MQITHVAVRSKGIKYSLPAPNRHHHVLEMMHRLGLLDDDEAHESMEQGFLVEDGVFVTRRVAFVLAKASGQMKTRLPGQYNGEELFSEDLW